tara:strand:- start:283 stop:1242 length:960 start_codon:yes stop_codon:yes gene_type:complete
MDLFNLFPKLTEKHVTLNDLDIPYRVFANWSEKNIIDYTVSDSAKDKNVTRRRVELDYFEALWMLITKELRLFGIPLNTIKTLKDFLLAPMDTSEFKRTSSEEIRELTQKAAPKVMSELMTDELFDKDNIESILAALPEQYKMYFTNLGGLVSSVILFEQSPSLMLYKIPLSNTSEFKIHIFNPIANKLEAERSGSDFRDELVTNLIHYSIINIPLMPLISRFYQNDALHKYSEKFALYSPSELEILKIVKNRDFKHIKIYNNQNKETFDIEITKERDFKKNKALKLKTLLGLKQYERAEVLFRNDKHIVIKNIIKKQV